MGSRQQPQPARVPLREVRPVHRAAANDEHSRLDRQNRPSMPHVITQQCCNDASCVSVCPVNCIHPTPEEPDYARAEMLHIDPATCIDCGACTDVDVCPVDAIVPDSALTPETIRYADLNARFFDDSTRTQYRR